MGLGGMMGNMFHRGTSSSPATSRRASPSPPTTTSSPTLSAESVASSPPPGQSGPTSFAFSPGKECRYLSFLSSGNNQLSSERKLCGVNMAPYSRGVGVPLSNATQSGAAPPIFALVAESSILECDSSSPNQQQPDSGISLEERLRRERQRVHSTGVTSFLWSCHGEIMVPLRGNIYIQSTTTDDKITCVYNKRTLASFVPQGKDSGAVDVQFSPNAKFVSFVVCGDLYILPLITAQPAPVMPTRITFRESEDVTHGLADFLAQEEMDRYRGYWWHPSSSGICFAKVDESCVSQYRIAHQGRDNAANSFEDHRYPFAGETNPVVSLAYVPVGGNNAKENWDNVIWFHPPSGASEYLTRVNWFPDGSVCAQWQNREQNVLILTRYDVRTGASTILLRETSDVWINLHHMLRSFPSPSGGINFLFASERTGYSHLYYYHIPSSGGEANLVRPISSGEWVVESIVGVDLEREWIYVMGTYDSPLERHLYALRLSPENGCPTPYRLTRETGMHNIVMDSNSRFLVDAHSDLNRPTAVQVHTVQHMPQGPKLECLFVLYDASRDEKLFNSNQHYFPPPELISFRTSDGTEELHAALYRPDHKIHGPGPYPLICSVYGGPHVQRVTRSWSQSADMRAQRLRSLGFAVVKCDNRGSSRRGLAFEGAIKRRLGRLEVLDQVTAVRHLTLRGIADPSLVGIYGWSYGGYLAAMCLCRAPDVFHVAVAGAPVTSWDGYDTHYTERYMGSPSDNPSGYRESAVFDHVGNIKGKLMIVHGLIDENVHFRHTTRLINRLIAAGKDYDLLLFPDERHSPRRLRDRVYMEQRISDYFIKHLLNSLDGTASASSYSSRDATSTSRSLAGHL